MRAHSLLVEQKWTRIKNPSPPSPSKCLRMARKQEGSYIWMVLRGKRGKTRALQRQLEEMGANGLQLKRGKLDKTQLTIQAACWLWSFIGFYWLLTPIRFLKKNKSKMKYDGTKVKLFFYFES